LVLYKTRRTGRSKITKSGNRDGSKQSKDYSRREREPRFLVTSFPASKASAVVKLYKQRMQIEESFRDLKTNSGLSKSGTYKANRAKLLLLFHHLASIVYWVIGLNAEMLKMKFSYQANTVRTKVLSAVYLGARVLRDKNRKHSFKTSWEPIEKVTMNYANDF